MMQEGIDKKKLLAICKCNDEIDSDILLKSKLFAKYTSLY